MAYTNGNSQTRVGVRIVPQVNASTLWNSIYSVYNADSVGSSSLKTSLYAAYNGESNANDSFGTNNGTPQGGLTYTTGKIGNAFNFNGTNAYVSIPNTSSQFDFTGDFSISTWVNTPNYTSNIIFSNYSLGGTYGYGIIIYHANNNIFGCALYNGNTIGQYHTSAGITTNSWNHVVVVRKVGQNTKIYINGTLSSGSYPLGNSSISPSFPGTQIVNIGSYSNGSGLTNYKQDATTIWQKELTQSEITELYNSGNGAQYITDSFYKPTTNDALNTYNGTAQGGLTYGVGKVGTAFQFNGSNAYVSLPANSLKFTNSTFSTSMWMYIPSNVSDDQILIGCLRFPSIWKGWAISMYQNTIYFYIGTASGKLDVTYGNNSLIGQWAHLVATHENGVGGKLYVNGVLRTTVANVNPIVYDSVETPSIGCAFVAGGAQPTWFMKNGSKLDAIGVWNRVLTTTEITELYNSGNGKQYPN